MKKTCIIKIDEEADRDEATAIDCQLNGVATIHVIEVLQALQKLLAQQLVKEAREQVGNDDAAIERWIDLQRQKPSQN